jgi:hypothetical protein
LEIGTWKGLRNRATGNANSRSPLERGPQASEQRTGGIRSRGSELPKGMSSTLFELAYSEIPIGVKDRGLAGHRSHGRGVSRGLKGTEVLSEIGSRGFVGAVLHDLVKVDFPTG